MALRAYKHLSTSARSQRSEKQAAKIIKGKVQPASGALPVLRLKADVTSKRFILEDKTTLNDSYRFKKADWQKLATIAWRTNKRPVFRVQFSTGLTLYVLDELTFEELTNE